MLHFDDNGTIDDAPLRPILSPFQLYSLRLLPFLLPAFSSPPCVPFFYRLPLHPSTLSPTSLPLDTPSGSHEQQKKLGRPAFFSKVVQDDKRLMLTSCFFFC